VSKKTRHRLFLSAGDDARKHKKDLEQIGYTSSYHLAFQDMDFLLREDLRPIRLQLELLKPELLLQEAEIQSTIVFYGSARIPDPDSAEHLVAKAKNDQERAIALRLKERSVYYTMARDLAYRISAMPQPIEGERHCVVLSGGGPSIMEAANRGAYDAEAPSIGFNIVLPHEQCPNPYIDPDLNFQFHYFALRKMHFLLRARALVAFPGGYGTLDELFEALTLIQTRKIKPIPVILFGQEFWTKAINFDFLVSEGMISPKDLHIFKYVEDVDQAWEIISPLSLLKSDCE